MNKISLLKGFAAFALVGLFGTSAIALSGHFEKSPLSANAVVTGRAMQEGGSGTLLALPDVLATDNYFYVYPAYGGEPIKFTTTLGLVGAGRGLWYAPLARLDELANTTNLDATQAVSLGDGVQYYFFGWYKTQVSATSYETHTINEDAVITFKERYFVDDFSGGSESNHKPINPSNDATYIANYKVEFKNGQSMSQIYIKNPNYVDDEFNFAVANMKAGNITIGVGIYGNQGNEAARYGMTLPKAQSDAVFLNISECEHISTAYIFGETTLIPETSKYVRLIAREVMTITIAGYNYPTIFANETTKDNLFIPADDPYQEGYEDGYHAGSDAGYQDGYGDGYYEGEHDGYNEGYATGYNEGKTWKPNAQDVQLPENWYPSQFVTYVTFWNYPRLPSTDAADVWFLLGSDDRNVAASQDVGTWNFYTDFEGRTTLYDGLYVHYKKFSGTNYYLINSEGQTQNVTTILGDDLTQYFIEGIYIRKTTDALTTPSGQSIPYNCIAKAKMGNVDGHIVVYDALDWVSDDYRNIHITVQTANTSSGYTWRSSIYTQVDDTEKWTWLECNYAEAIKATGVSKVTSFAAQQDNAFNLLSSAFSSVASIMNIAILPYITLGTLIFIPLVVTIIVAVVKMLGK